MRIVQCFSDLGVSGTIEALDRPALVKMLTFMADRGISVLVVERMDRLARDLMVSELLIRELKRRNIRLYSAENGLVDQCTDNSDPGRVFVRQILGAQAQYDKSALVLKLRGARERAKRDYGIIGGIKPYGQNRSEQLIIEIVVRMREGAGASWGSIARALKTAGLRKRNGNINWCGPEIKSLLDFCKKNHARRKAIETRLGSGDVSSQSEAAESGGTDC
jgi:DNA invertase Pin-like site-specific DNA recombinase